MLFRGCFWYRWARPLGLAIPHLLCTARLPNDRPKVGTGHFLQQQGARGHAPWGLVLMGTFVLMGPFLFALFVFSAAAWATPWFLGQSCAIAGGFCTCTDCLLRQWEPLLEWSGARLQICLQIRAKGMEEAAFEWMNELSSWLSDTRTVYAVEISHHLL